MEADRSKKLGWVFNHQAAGSSLSARETPAQDIIGACLDWDGPERYLIWRVRFYKSHDLR